MICFLISLQVHVFIHQYSSKPLLIGKILGISIQCRVYVLMWHSLAKSKVLIFSSMYNYDTEKEQRPIVLNIGDSLPNFDRNISHSPNVSRQHHLCLSHRYWFLTCSNQKGNKKWKHIKEAMGWHFVTQPEIMNRSILAVYGWPNNHSPVILTL